MGKTKASKPSEPSRKMRPALTPDAQENQMIALAINLAERQLMEGTASSQVITHYLKLASSKERREKEKMEEEIKLLRAKTEALQQAQRIEELYSDVIDAMKRYSGFNESEVDEDDSDYD